jgi:hypothetical protein
MRSSGGDGGRRFGGGRPNDRGHADHRSSWSR